jgi:hypothetical protein
MIPMISIYADGVVLFCHPTTEDIMAIKEIRNLFGRTSGLQVNFSKSSATLIHCSEEDTDAIGQHFRCPSVLPIIYMGISLTVCKPTAAQMQPLIEKARDNLPTCNARLMNKSGRLELVKSVLSAIPMHQLLVLAPPKKSTKQLEKTEGGFLWTGSAEANGRNCHVNRRRVCRPISLGGLGVSDLERAGLALRLRWLWYSHTDTNRAWSNLELQFSAEEHTLFFTSTSMSVGNGQTALFWDDRWISGSSISEIAPQLHACTPKRWWKVRTIADGLQANI